MSSTKQPGTESENKAEEESFCGRFWQSYKCTITEPYGEPCIVDRCGFSPCTCTCIYMCMWILFWWGPEIHQDSQHGTIICTPRDVHGPGGWLGWGNKENHGISWAAVEGPESARQPFCLPLSLFHFLYVMFWLPVRGRVESDILFGSWQHHSERKMKRDGDNTETHAFTHTSCRPVHPTLFIGQFKTGNLGPS